MYTVVKTFNILLYQYSNIYVGIDSNNNCLKYRKIDNIL